MLSEKFLDSLALARHRLRVEIIEQRTPRPIVGRALYERCERYWLGTKHSGNAQFVEWETLSPGERARWIKMAEAVFPGAFEEE